MKRSLLTLIVILTVSVLTAQVPQGFNYQGVARNSDGTALDNSSISVRIGILNGSDLVWQEDHSSVPTNPVGLFNLVIGDVAASKSGGSAASFSDIDWGGGSYSIEVSIDAGSGYTSMGTTPLMSVPYAMYAGNQGQAGSWQMNADTLYTNGSVGIGTSTPNQSLLSIQSADPQTEKPLFEVKNDLGNPVFAVYNNGVMVYVDESKKGVKGGFAVGGYNANKAGEVQDYFRITPDSARIYVREDPLLKGVKGGFAVGGYNVNKAGPQELLYISPDSTRIYVDESETGKGVKGGFAVGGYNTTSKGMTREFLRITPDSTRIYIDEDPGTGKGVKGGFAVGGYNTTSKGMPRDLLRVTPDSTRIYVSEDAQGKGTKGGFAVGGYSSVSKGLERNFLEVSSSRTNIFFDTTTTAAGKGVKGGFAVGGYNASKQGEPDQIMSLTEINYLIGKDAGVNITTGTDNTFFGWQTGYSTTEGSRNILLGKFAGFNNKKASENVMIGTNAGYSNVGEGGFFDGDYNVFIGYNSGYYNVAGGGNVFLGYYAGWSSDSGDYQTVIGHAAGAYSEGQWNTFIGAEAGIGSEFEPLTGEENTYIGIYAGSDASGWHNTYLGYEAGSYAPGYYNTYLGASAGLYGDGEDNTLLGAYAGYGSSESNYYYNTYVGSSAGESTTTGSSNTILGYYAGYSLTTGSGNVFLGSEAGFNETGDNKLYIANSGTDFPLIYGDFGTENLRFNANVGVNASGIDGYGLVVDVPSGQTGYSIGAFGDIYTDGDYYTYTGYTNLITFTGKGVEGNLIANPLDKIKQLNGLSYERNTKSGTKNSIGLSAAEVEKVFPELVKKNIEGQKGINYDGLVPVLIEAIKDQQSQIESLQAEIEALKTMIEQ